MAKIKPESLEELKGQIDIVEVVSHYLQLKRVGVNYVALCPFHPEKTPSFYVSPKLQIYHCFGCGATGDAIKFVMEYEKLSFPEAVEKIASFYNFRLEYMEQFREGFSRELLERVADYYSSLLKPGTPGWEYLRGRGVSEESIEKFQLGFAPGREEQLRFFREGGFNFKELVRLGVLVEGERGPYPRLIDRVTFPIHSTSGRVIAFGGRTIGDHPAKYINFSNTPLFNKSRALYGYHLAREGVRRSREIVVTEGYLDVIMLHQAGIANVVATLGTALTGEHLPLLHRLTDRVVLCYDGDRAGREAAAKGAALLYRAGFSGRVVLLPEGTDPADLVAQHQNPRSYLEEGVPLGDFLVGEVVRLLRHLRDPAEVTKLIDRFTPYLHSLREEQREYLLSQLVYWTGISRERWLGESRPPFGSGEGEAGELFQRVLEGVRLEGGQLEHPPLSAPEKPEENPFEERQVEVEPAPPGEVSISEGEVVKTLAEHPDWRVEVERLLIGGVPSRLPELLVRHRPELELVYDGRLDHPAVVRLLLHPALSTLSWEELVERVRGLEKKWALRELRRLELVPMPAPEKVEKMRLLRWKLVAVEGQLSRKGELTQKEVVDESGCPF